MKRVPPEYITPLEDACTMFNIDTSRRQSMFLAQIAHETAGFTRMEENLNYGPAGLLRTFRRYFTPEEAVEFAHDGTRIAERVYGGRLGNRPEGAGDGWAYRGRGFVQLSGRGNFRKAGRALHLPLEDYPDLAAEPREAAMIAGWYWEDNGCNELADAGNFEQITRIINGGLNGYEDRVAWLRSFQEIA